MEALRADIRDAIARDRAAIMSRIEGMGNRLTALLGDLGVNWDHVDHVDQKVDNLRDETRLGGRTVVDIMTMVRALEGRIAKLERGPGHRPNDP